MKYIPKRSFLLRQEQKEGEKKKDVIAKRGEPIEMSQAEAIKFWGAIQMDEALEKKLYTFAKANNLRRLV